MRNNKEFCQIFFIFAFILISSVHCCGTTAWTENNLQLTEGTYWGLYGYTTNLFLYGNYNYNYTATITISQPMSYEFGWFFKGCVSLSGADCSTFNFEEFVPLTNTLTYSTTLVSPLTLPLYSIGYMSPYIQCLSSNCFVSVDYSMSSCPL